MIRHLKKIMLLLMLLPLVTQAEESFHYVIVSGQVINYEYGNPVKNHSVFVQPQDNQGHPNRDVIELITDKEGFYYDSIPTDQLKGAFTIYTFDHFGHRLDTTLHYRFLFFNSNVLVADFRIYMPYQMELLQTRFNYYQKQNGDRFTYLFQDMTNSENIISRVWDFGDGTGSDKAVVKHTYTTPGFYKITLTVEAIVGNALQSSTFSRMIYLSDRSYYNFGGHAFNNYFPIDYGVAYLYILDSSRSFIPIDTAYIDTLGYYYFYQVPESDYLVKAQPAKNSEAYGKMLPTYYGDALFWEEAQTIHLEQTGWEYDIHLQNAEGMEAGNGFVHGNISFFNGYKDGNPLPAEGIPVYLMGNNHSMLVYRYSDSTGDFTFRNIAFGDYVLKPEITGIHCDEVSVEVSNVVPEIDSIQILIQDGEASLFIPEQVHKSGDMLGNPYPVPASDRIHVAVNVTKPETLQWQISDVTGKTVGNGTWNPGTGDHIFEVRLPGLKNGLYFIRFADNDGNAVQRKFLINR